MHLRFNHTFLTPATLFLLTLFSSQVSLLAQSGTEPLLLNGHTTGTRHGSFSPDGTTVVSVGNDGFMRFWDAGTGEEVRSFKESKPSFTVFYRPDGEEVIRAGDSTAQVRNALSGQMRLWFTYDDRHVSQFAIYSPDGARFLTVGADYIPRIWDASNGAKLKELHGHTFFVADARFSPDGAYIATVSSGPDHTVRVWSVETGEETARYTADSYAFSVDWSREGTSLLITTDSSVQIRDASNGALIRTVVDNVFADQARFVAGDRYIAVNSLEGNVFVYDVVEGNVVQQLAYPDGLPTRIEIAPDDHRIVVVYTNSKLGIWDLGLSSVQHAVAGESVIRLNSIYPNPAHDHIRLPFSLSHSAVVQSSLIDVSGRQIAVRAAEFFESGEHQFEWDVSNLTSGLYYCIVRIGEESQVQEIRVVR